jgi:hypothetical protein
MRRKVPTPLLTPTDGEYIFTFIEVGYLHKLIRDIGGHVLHVLCDLSIARGHRPSGWAEQHGEGKEGARAFAEKRPADFARYVTA